MTHDARKFFKLLLAKNGYLLEQLYSPLVVLTTPEHEDLKSIARGCITRHHNHHYRGFARPCGGYSPGTSRRESSRCCMCIAYC